MKKIKTVMSKSLNLLLCFLMIIMNFSPLFTMTVHAADSNTNGTYGIVYFRTKGCGATTDYYNVETGKYGYTNGCYGADGAFLGYNSDKSQVKFKMAGVTGWVNTNDVKVIDYLNYFDDYYTSYYSVENGILRHHIMSDIYNKYSGSIIDLGPKPSFLSEGKNYWSYDGHYFYDANINGGTNGYKTMIDDYVNGSNNNAINRGNPYYNYYQYITHRTQSNYTDTDILKYLNNTLGINSPMTSYPATKGQSLLYGEQTSFVQYQNEFGANLGLVLGLAQNESANGTSNIAYYGKNLFGHSAFDSSPGASADSYLSVAQSIYAHDKFFVSEGYLDPCDQRNVGGSYNDSLCQLGRYNGGHVGDKNSGMNVDYASDPYWGEKAAQFYYIIDDAGGMQDYNKYTIAIKTSASNIGVYKDASSSSTLLYKTGNIPSYPVVVLGETTGETVNGSNKWYKIQTDPTLNSSRTGILQDYGNYDFNNNYGYVPASYFTKVNTGKELKNRYTITFDPNGGKFTDGETASKKMTVEQNVVPKINNPVKDNDQFMGWTPTVMGASENVTYKAMWRNTKYDITFNPNGGKFADGVETNKTVKYEAGTMPSSEQLTKDGYTFKGWSPAFQKVTENATYTAIWEKNKVYYDITFDANGGKFSDDKTTVTTKYEEGKLPSITDPTRSGYIFEGWDKQIVNASGNTTYTAKWKVEVKYNITFDADGGKFSDGKDIKTVSTNEGVKPNVETPTKDGYVFKGWTPELVNATKETSYKATWEKGTIEDTLTKKDGWFHLEKAELMDNKLDISGYLILKNMNNNIDATYEMILIEEDSKKEFIIKLDSWINNVPFKAPSNGNYDNSIAWFKGKVDLSVIPEGNYTGYIRKVVAENYTKVLLSNIEFTTINNRKEKDSSGRGYMIRENMINRTIPLELVIRDSGLITYSEAPTDDSMFNTLFGYSFESNNLILQGTSHIVKGNYSPTTNVERKIYIENVETKELVKKDVNIGYIDNGPYKVSLRVSDGFDKTRAWYKAKINISDLPKGRYAIYIKTSSNVEDYSELNDMAYTDLDVETVVNGKKVKLERNENKRLRLELVVY